MGKQNKMTAARLKHFSLFCYKMFTMYLCVSELDHHGIVCVRANALQCKLHPCHVENRKYGATRGQIYYIYMCECGKEGSNMQVNMFIYGILMIERKHSYTACAIILYRWCLRLLHVLILDNRYSKQNIATHPNKTQTRRVPCIFVHSTSKHMALGFSAVDVSEHEYMFYFYARHSNPMYTLCICIQIV